MLIFSGHVRDGCNKTKFNSLIDSAALVLLTIILIVAQILTAKPNINKTLPKDTKDNCYLPVLFVEPRNLSMLSPKGNTDVVAPISAPMLQIVPIPKKHLA